MLIRIVTLICLMLPYCIVLAQNDIADTFPSPALDTAIRPQTSVVVNNIAITGNRRTKIYIVEREFAFEKNVTYSQQELDAKIKLTKEQLINTTLFVDVIITSIAAGNGSVNLIVLVKERIYLFPVPFFRVIDRNYNEWLNTYNADLARVNYGVKISQNNLTGSNDKLNIWVIGGYTQQVQFDYTLPYLDKELKHGLFFGFHYGRNREVNYATDFDTLQYLKLSGFARTFYSGDIGYSYRPGSKERHSVRLTYTSDKIDSAIGKQNQEFFGKGALQGTFADLTYTFQYFNVDYIKYPLRGWYVDVYAKKRFSKTLGMWAIGGKYLQSWHLPLPSTYFTFQAAGTLKLPFKQPYYNSHLLGFGDVSMRGMEYLVVDGVAGGVLKGTLTKKLLVITIKNPIKSKTHDRLPFTFYGKVYGDLGYVATRDQTNNSRLSNKLLRTAGFGLDIITIYDLILKIEFGFNQLGNHGLYYHSGSDF